MAPMKKLPKEDFKKQMDIVYSLLSMLNSDPILSPNSFRLLGGNSLARGKEVTVNYKVLEAVMRLTFEEKYRQSICNLEGLQAIATILINYSSKLNGKSCSENFIKTLKHTCMALTNLTFGDVKNKNTVCSIEGFIPALVKLLGESNEELRKVVAGVVRNVSWKADAASKKVLRESGMVYALLKGCMESERESTLKCLLNALWNVSSHSAENKGDICEYPHSLEFIVSLLGQSETIIENGGGILKNISSHIAVNDHCRQILRQHKCLEILLAHLQSSNMVVVANACGTLWNLSARCSEDQQSLWKLGAVGLLGNLVNSEDKAISVGSSAALKNLLLFKTNSSSLFSSCSSSPSDDKNKEGGYWSEKKHARFKEKEASADSSTINSFQPVSFSNVKPSNKVEANNHQSKEFFENDMKSENQFYGLDESADEMIDFSTKYKEICLESSNDQLLDSSKSLYSPSEHPKLYCTEDTPENYSEINGSPAYNLNDLDTSMGFVLTTSTNHVDSKLFEKPQKTILLKSSGSSENSSHPNSGHKSVTFSETNQTPMMFSRTTSLGSVNSFEAPSVHSSVGSVYSHRPSGLVSPSELPDSPGETMPPSPQAVTSPPESNNSGGQQARDGNEDDVNDSDFSDNENDDLLEEVIQAAMPGCARQDKRLCAGKAVYEEDTLQCYRSEGTPLTFSRNDSLSSLGCKETDKKDAEHNMLFHKSCLISQNDVLQTALPHCGAREDKRLCAGKAVYEEDILQCYRSEGTPLTFSRNDSLSSLGSKDSPHRPNNYSLTALHPKVKTFIVKHDEYLKTVSSNFTSTPSAKAIPILEDQVLKYEVEGTPDKVPPLSFDDLPTHNKAFSYDSTTHPQTTIQAFSHLPTSTKQPSNLDDSDSSVSFNSSDVESSPHDNRLLQECIASGLPKNKKRKHKRFLFDYDQLKNKKDTGEISGSSKNNESLRVHDLSRAAYSDDDYALSGPSTEANNTVIYRGLLLNGEMEEECGENGDGVVLGEAEDGKDDEKCGGDVTVEGKEGDNIGVRGEDVKSCVVEENIETTMAMNNDGETQNIPTSAIGESEDLKINEENKASGDKSTANSDSKEDSWTSHHLALVRGSNVFGNYGEMGSIKDGGMEYDEMGNDGMGDGGSEDGALGESVVASVRLEGDVENSLNCEVASTASDGKYKLFTNGSSDCTDENDLPTIVSEFYDKTCIREIEDSRYHFKTNPPITSSISDGNFTNSLNQEWPVKSVKEKKHSKSKIFEFLKKSLRRKKKKPS